MANYNNRFNNLHLEFDESLPADCDLSVLQGASGAAPKLLSDPSNSMKSLVAASSSRTAPNCITEQVVVEVGGQVCTILRTLSLHRRLSSKRSRWSPVIEFLEVTLELCRRVHWPSAAAWLFGTWVAIAVLRWVFG